MLQRWRESNPYFFNMADQPKHTQTLTHSDMETIARESVADMANILRLHGISIINLSEKERSIFSEIYRAGMIKTIDFMMKKKDEK